MREKANENFFPLPSYLSKNLIDVFLYSLVEIKMTPFERPVEVWILSKIEFASSRVLA